jgi:hypothetical protein
MWSLSLLVESDQSYFGRFLPIDIIEQLHIRIRAPQLKNESIAVPPGTSGSFAALARANGTRSARISGDSLAGNHRNAAAKGR